MGATLHVTNGESAGNTLRSTTLGGAVLSWQDVLTEGPVPRLPPAQLRDVRARFLADCGWGSRRTIRDDLARRDRLLETALADGRPVVLWFEHDLYDQLQLVQVLVQAGEAPLELVQADVFLGSLHEPELEEWWERREPVSDDLRELARCAWDAFRAPDPTALAELVAAPPRNTAVQARFLVPALRRLLEEVPDGRTGLGRSERQLLEALADGPRTPPEVFLAAQAREEAAFDGDAWVWRRLASLAPLIAPANGGALPEPPPRGDARRFASTRVVLAGAGREVLAGRADRVDAAGIDRWLGGVHLTPESDWRRDGTRLYLRSS